MSSSNIAKSFLATIVVAFLAVTFAVSQPQGRQRRGVPRYDTATETTVTGTVQEVKQVTGRAGWGGTHLTLKTEGGELDVHAGPTTFLDQKGFTFAKGDQIEVTGSKVKYQDADAIIAREIKKGDKLLTLRDAKGFPLWSRRGQ